MNPIRLSSHRLNEATSSSRATPELVENDSFVGKSYDSLSSCLLNPYPASPAISSASLSVGEAEIPLIDLEAIRAEKSPEKRKGLIADFGDSLKNVGFIAIKAESLTPMIQEVNRMMKAYFEQPLQVKMEDWHSNGGQTGFSPEGTETAAGAKKPDRKELYFVPPNFNKWPKSFLGEEFKRVMTSYHSELTKYEVTLMEFLTEYLEQPLEGVSDMITEAENLLRLAHYFAAKKNEDPEAMWAAAHYDLNALTLLPPSLIPGLQLSDKKGEWKAVNAPQGTLIVNTGEQLEFKTAGEFKAVLHRVVNPGGTYAYLERFASIFFGTWRSDYSLKPYDCCVERMTRGMSEEERLEYLKAYPSVTVSENLVSRLIEMGTIKNPSKEEVCSLLEKGLLRQPTDHLRQEYPELFSK